MLAKPWWRSSSQNIFLPFDEEGLSLASRHWASLPWETPLPLVRWRNHLTNVWTFPTPLLTTRGQGYACVFPWNQPNQYGCQVKIFGQTQTKKSSQTTPLCYYPTKIELPKFWDHCISHIWPFVVRGKRYLFIWIRAPWVNDLISTKKFSYRNPAQVYLSLFCMLFPNSLMLFLFSYCPFVSLCLLPCAPGEASLIMIEEDFFFFTLQVFGIYIVVFYFMFLKVIWWINVYVSVKTFSYHAFSLALLLLFLCLSACFVFFQIIFLFYFILLSFIIFLFLMRDRKDIDAVKEEVWRTLWKLGEGRIYYRKNIFYYIF